MIYRVTSLLTEIELKVFHKFPIGFSSIGQISGSLKYSQAKNALATIGNGETTRMKKSQDSNLQSSDPKSEAIRPQAPDIDD